MGAAGRTEGEEKYIRGFVHLRCTVCGEEFGIYLQSFIKEPGKKPRITEIENSLSALQEAVGGYIETVTFAEDCCVVCNEEGRLQGLPYNLTFCGVSFVGTILFIGVLGDEFADLSKEYAEILLGQLERSEQRVL